MFSSVIEIILSFHCIVIKISYRVKITPYFGQPAGQPASQSSKMLAPAG